jgi:DNA modification methylase
VGAATRQSTPTIRDRVVELRRVRAGELLENPKNWRRHPAGQARALRSLLERVGYAGALLARETGAGLELIDGHLRAATTPDEVVPVLILDVDQAEADLLLASLDPLGGLAETDEEALRALLEQVDFPPDLAEALGVADPNEPVDGLTDPDQVPPTVRKPAAATGDLWVMGAHRLVCGDALLPETLQWATGGDLVDMVWTDPPYNVAYEGGTAERLTIDNDALDHATFGAFITEAFRVAFDVTKPGGPIYTCHPDGGIAGLVFRQALEATGWELKQVLIWVKSAFVLSRQDYHWQHEPIPYGWKPGAAHAWFGGFTPSTVIDDDVEPSKMSKADLVAIVEQLRVITTVMREEKPHRNAEHPTIKPVGLVERALVNSTRPGGSVLDPFAGAGTVIVAAERLGRAAVAVEIDPQYCDVAVKRWEAFTGEKAERIRG